MRKLIVFTKGRANGKNPFPDGKPPVITIVSPKKKTPAKKKKAPSKGIPGEKTKTTRKKRQK